MSTSSIPVAVARRPARRVLARALSASSLAWTTLVAFLAFEVLVISRWSNGPFLDESIYLTAGRRALEGHGGSDYYLTWFAGSLVWPVLAGIADALGGLEAARVLAALCVAGGLAAAVRATGLLAGPRAQPWAAAVGVTSGAVLSLGHLAVYDALAVLGVGIALWSTLELERSDDRRWAGLLAIALVGAGLAKYPVLVFGGVPACALVVALRGRRAALDLALVAFVGGGILLAYFLLERDQLVRFLEFRASQNPSFGLTRAQVGWLVGSYVVVPFGLALVGLTRATPRQRRAGLALALAPLAPLAYHLGGPTAVGIEKHAVVVVLCSMPLAGVALERAARGPLRAMACLVAVGGLGALGVVQMQRVDEGWLDQRGASAFLTSNVHRGDLVLADQSWPYADALYARGTIDTPYAVLDAYRVAHGAASDLCRARWFVVTPWSGGWPPSVMAAVRRCGSFRLAYSTKRGTLAALGSDLRWITARGDVLVYRNLR